MNCPLTGCILHTRCKVKTCMWNTSVLKYKKGCLYEYKLSDNELAEAKQTSLLELERERQKSTKRIKKTIVLYRYLEYIQEKNDYVTIDEFLIEPKEKEFMLRLLAFFPFSFQNRWNISTLLAALSEDRFLRFANENNVSLALQSTLMLNDVPYSKLRKIKHRIGKRLTSMRTT